MKTVQLLVYQPVLPVSSPYILSWLVCLLTLQMSKSLTQPQIWSERKYCLKRIMLLKRISFSIFLIASCSLMIRLPFPLHKPRRNPHIFVHSSSAYAAAVNNSHQLHHCLTHIHLLMNTSLIYCFYLKWKELRKSYSFVLCANLSYGFLDSMFPMVFHFRLNWQNQ